MKEARVSILEYRLLEAVVKSSDDIQAAKELVNTQINPKALELAKIRPLSDVHKTLWKATEIIFERKGDSELIVSRFR